MTPSDRKFQIVPPEEQRCVWMTAGILTYQLCDREFDCDECPFDGAMRKHFSRPPVVAESRPREPMPLTNQDRLPPGYHYSPNHFWLKAIEANLLQAGIEPGLSAALLGPKAVVFPSPGQQVQSGHICLWIVLDGGTLALGAPISGVVWGTNRRLAEEPHLLQRHPLDLGWLFEIEADAPPQEKTAGLMTPEQAAVKYASDENRFLTLLTAELRGSRPSVGITLADGGHGLQDVADMLGPRRYFSLIRRVYG